MKRPASRKTSASAAPILRELRRGILRIRLNRPESLNTYTPEMTEAIIAALESARDDDRVRVLIICAAGPAFCCGADFRYVLGNEGNSKELGRFNRRLNVMMNMLSALPKPTIAEVHGYAFGGGLEMILACDLAVAADDVVISDPHAKVDFIHGAGGSQRLPRIVGPRRAMELALTGRRIDAAAALQMGLVNRVAPRAKLAREVDALANEMIGYSTRTLAEIKRLLQTAGATDLATGLGIEEEAFLSHMSRPGAFDAIRGYISGWNRKKIKSSKGRAKGARK